MKDKVPATFAGVVDVVKQTYLEEEAKRLAEERSARLALRQEAKAKGKLNASEFIRALAGSDVTPDTAFKTSEEEQREKPKSKPTGSFPAPPKTK